jgi:hypothetical protein
MRLTCYAGRRPWLARPHYGSALNVAVLHALVVPSKRSPPTRGVTNKGQTQ